jgi:lysyl oxidase
VPRGHPRLGPLRSLGAVACAIGIGGLGAPGGLAGCGDQIHLGRDAGDAAAPRDAAIDSAVDAPPDAPADGMPDLQFVSSEMAHSLLLDTIAFRAADCEVVEGCVGDVGTRTLLRFNTVSANRGTADIFVGVPPPPGESNDVFEWSPCHMHHHVKNYASYELRDAGGNVVLTARKQSFCLEDSEPVQPGIPSAGYSCMRQGITRGWADVYDRELPCQWIDVTDIPHGSYTLYIVVNPLHTLPESNYDNNTFSVAVQL